jgi:hypothetical protein
MALLSPKLAWACFSGYYAPAFGDVTDLVIGSGMVVLVCALILGIKRKAKILNVIAPGIYLFLSYYGHWIYSGDCGSQIVFLNKLALGVVILWLLFEVVKYRSAKT